MRPLPPSPTAIITVTRLGKTFKASRRTVAWLDRTIKRFNDKFEYADLIILQTPFNDGVAASAGSHDYDVAFDLWFTGTLVPGETLEEQGWRLQKFLRAQGGFFWFRHTGDWAKQSSWHCHGGPLPKGLTRFATKVGAIIDGGVSQFGYRVTSSQLDDYLEGRNGLAGHAADQGWRPLLMQATVFNYDRWVRKHGAPK